MRIVEPVSTLVSTAPELPTITSRVDPEGARRMMEMLVNLYADRRLAVVREYVSNAVDATRAAGSAEPVAVTTPTLIEPNFVVSDRGTGMSLDEVEAMFLAFAASTKRDSDELIGGLGVGAKSAWALAESFVVDTVKDGRRTMVRAASNLEHQVLVSNSPSDLPDGTTIIVPVEVANHVQAWQRVVHEVACAHDQGAVLVDGAPVNSIAGGPEWIGPVGCRPVDRGDRTSVVIRSGGTLFASVPEITTRVLEGTGLVSCVVELPIGTFDHTPSRESIVATDRTRGAVEKALADFRSSYDALGQKVSKLAATDVAAAVKLRAEALGGVGSARMLPIPFRFGFPAGCQEWAIRNRSGRSRWERMSHFGNDTFEAVAAPVEMAATLVVTDVPVGRAVGRFAKLLSEKHPKIRRVVAIPEGQPSLALDVLGKVGVLSTQRWEISSADAGVQYTFEQWRSALAAERTVRGAVRGYDCVVVDRDGATPRMETLSAAEVGGSALPVIYIEGERPLRASLGEPASVTVYLGRRKCGPLLAEVPRAMTHDVWAEKRFSAATAGWSATELLAVTYTQKPAYKTAFEVAAQAVAVIPADHPRRELLEPIALIVEAASKVTAAQTAAVSAWSGCAKVQELSEAVRKLHGELYRAYPLLRHSGSWDNAATRAHYVEYVTHVPAATVRDAA